MPLSPPATPRRVSGKPLALLAGKPVIEHVYEQVTKILPEAWVATDDDRIYEAVKAFGGNAVMTRADHKSGTDRIEEAAEKINTDADVIVNVGETSRLSNLPRSRPCADSLTIRRHRSPPWENLSRRWTP